MVQKKNCVDWYALLVGWYKLVVLTGPRLIQNFNEASLDQSVLPNCLASVLVLKVQSCCTRGCFGELDYFSDGTLQSARSQLSIFGIFLELWFLLPKDWGSSNMGDFYSILHQCWDPSFLCSGSLISPAFTKWADGCRSGYYAFAYQESTPIHLRCCISNVPF